MLVTPEELRKIMESRGREEALLEILEECGGAGRVELEPKEIVSFIRDRTRRKRAEVLDKGRRKASETKRGKQGVTQEMIDRALSHFEEFPSRLRDSSLTYKQQSTWIAGRMNVSPSKGDKIVEALRDLGHI